MCPRYSLRTEKKKRDDAERKKIEEPFGCTACIEVNHWAIGLGSA